MRADGDHAPIGCTVSRRRIVGQADLVAIRIRSVLVLPVHLTHFYPSSHFGTACGDFRSEILCETTSHATATQAKPPEI